MNNTLIDKMNNFCGRLYSFTPSPAAYRLTYVIFIVLHIFTAFFHEPWYDEAQAWLIARDASYYDILFDIPHYEGHPPLWHLILSIPAKLGLPFEISLSAVMLFFSAIWVYLIMFRSPFCGLLKLLLPFTYYVFYQYGIVARPYVLVGLALTLAAMFHSSRDEKPLRYILSLLLLCTVHAYGIIISGGLAAVWCFEIFLEYKGSKPFSALIKDKRCCNLLFLLVCALALILCIMPTEDTFILSTENNTVSNYIMCLLFMLFMLPSDCTILGLNSGLSSAVLIRSMTFAADCIPVALIGIIILLSIVWFAYRKKKLLSFIVPYLMLAVFGTIVHFVEHHTGTAQLLFLYILWVCLSDSNDERKINLNDSILIIPKMSLVLCISINLIWSITGIIRDTAQNYWYGREASEFLSEHELTSLKIMSTWHKNAAGIDIGAENIQMPAVSINAYFDNNIFYYFYNGNPDKSYSDHKSSTNLQTTYNKWRNDIPDVLVGPPNIDLVYDGRITLADYTCVKHIRFSHLWKMNALQQNFYIYIRNDLMENYPELSAVE